MEKKLYAIFHGHDEKCVFGDAVYTEDMMGVVSATEEEIKAYVEKWNKPIIYDSTYTDFSCHNVYAQEVSIVDLNELNPYGKDDPYGLLAKEYEFKKAFKAEHGWGWEVLDNRKELYDLYSKGLEEIRKKHEEEL